MLLVIISSVLCTLDTTEQLSLELDAPDIKRFGGIARLPSERSFHSIITSGICGNALNNIATGCMDLEHNIKLANKNQTQYSTAALLRTVKELRKLCANVCRQAGIVSLNYKRDCKVRHPNLTLLDFADILFDAKEYIEAQKIISESILSGGKLFITPPQFTNRSNIFKECSGGRVGFREFMAAFYLHLSGMARCLKSKIGPSSDKENASPNPEMERSLEQRA